MTTITATPPKLDSEALTLKSTSLWQITWHRLFRRKSSVVGMIILALLVTIALTAQWLAPYSPTLSMLDVDPPQDIQKRSSPSTTTRPSVSMARRVSKAMPRP